MDCLEKENALKRLNYHAPQSVQECVEILEADEGATLLAGGTDLIPRLKDPDCRATTLVSLRRMPELRGVIANGRLDIGAATTLSDLLQLAGEHSMPTALREASAIIGSVQIRNAATIGGNICNAAPSADTAPALLALDGCVSVYGRGGTRRMELAQFFKGPGQTVVGQGELVTRIDVPCQLPDWGSCYMRHTPRSRMDLAVTGVAVALQVKGTEIIDARIALGAVAPTPRLCHEAAQRLIGQKPERQIIEEISKLASMACSPIGDVRASASYRRHLVSVLVKQAVAKAYKRACSCKKESL